MQTRRSRLLLKTCSDTAISPYLESVILSADASVSQTPLQGRDSPQFRREENITPGGIKISTISLTRAIVAISSVLISPDLISSFRFH